MQLAQMSSRLATIWDHIRTSFWFVPGLMMLGALGLIAIALGIDHELSRRPAGELPWWVYVSNPNDARNVVSALLTSMITMTSLVFSVTMVVLTLAANQFGPRLIRNFMASPETQYVLGAFVMTILYCLLTLASIGRRGSEGVYPFAIVTLAIVLIVVSIVLLVFYIHALARSIVSETVIARVGAEFDALLDALEPLAAGKPAEGREDVTPPDLDARSACFGPRTSGYVQAVEFGKIIKAAKRENALVVLHFKPGDYLAAGGRSLAVYPRGCDNPRFRDAICDAIVVGERRTPVQDLEFSMRHLVEIALRALSPGVNDPYTAVAVVHRLSASLSRAMGLTLPPGIYRDEEGAVRALCHDVQHSTLIGLAYNQIRQNAAGKPLVVLHLLEAYARIAEHVRLPEQAEALQHQLETTREAMLREIPSPSDRADVTAAAERARLAIERAAPGN